MSIEGYSWSFCENSWAVTAAIITGIFNFGDILRHNRAVRFFWQPRFLL